MPGYELIGREERDAVNQVFDDGGVLFSLGFDAMRKGRFRVRELEQAFAKKIGVRHAQAVSSGTAALKTALAVMGIKPGDEVITQAFTFVATVEAIADVGAVPVIVNIDDTLNMDPEELKRAITPRTKAIIPVHMLGVAAEVEAIMEIANARGIRVLEDNCESLGATWNSRPLGTHSHITAWSFDFGKVITTGEGGMVTTNDEELFKLACEYHDHGHENNPKVPRGRDTRRIHGFNFRLTELQAAVGLAQLPKLDEVVAKNRAHWQIIRDALNGIKGLAFRRIPSPCTPLCDCLIFELPSKDIAERFASRMAAAKLGTKILPDALDWHFAGTWDHIFKPFGMDREALQRRTQPSADRLYRCVSIPIMVNYTPERAAEIGSRLRTIAHELLG